MNLAEIDDAAAPGGTALLIVDMITDLDFAEAEAMRARVLAAGDVILKLRDQADTLGVPVVYVNDHYGHWHSERSQIIEHCLREDSRGRDLVRRIQPRPDDYFVIKTQFSGFYASSLPVLLPKLRANRLILTGIAADICVLFTAADAHMRDYGLWVPRDATVAANAERAGWAIDMLRVNMRAEVRPTAELSLQAWIGAAGDERELMPEGLPARAAD